jgi:hypothetical protein
MPLPLETVGYRCEEIIQLMLMGFARKLAMEAVGGVDASDKEIKAAVNHWLGFWLDRLAVVQARFTARAVYNRASACKDAANAPFRHDTLVDVDHANAPRTLPQPENARAAAERAAAAAALAP